MSDMRMLCGWRLCCLLLLWMLGGLARADTGSAPFVVPAHPAGAFINASVDYFIDTSNGMTVEQVARQARFTSTQGKPGLGVTSHPVWVRFSLQRSAGAHGDYKLEYLGVSPGLIDFYVGRQNGGFEVHRSGDYLPFATRPFPFASYVYALTLPETGVVTYYMRLLKPGVQSVPMRIWEPQEWIVHALLKYLSYGLCLGVMFGLALYNLLLFVRLRDALFAFYFLTVLSYMWLAADYSGLAAHVVYPDWLSSYPGRSALAGSSWGFWGVVFSITLLKGPDLPPWLVRVFYVFAVLYASVWVAVPLGYTAYGAQVITLAPMVWFPLALGVAAYKVWRKSLPALFYLLGFGPVLAGLILYIINVRGQTTPSATAISVFIWMGAWEAILFSQALAQRVNEFKRAREEAQQHAAAVDAELAAVERKRIHTDQLTGLASREYIRATGDAWLAQGMEPLVLVVNIDRFKSINDVLGYANGDAVLIATGRRLASIPDVVVGRLHANQFGLICSQVARLDELRQRVEAIFTAPLSVGGHSVDISLSVGVMVNGETGADMTQRIRNAEIALLAGRRLYKDWLPYDVSMETSHQADLALLSALRRAVEADELQLYLQPKIRMGSGMTDSAEALVRWQHPERGLLQPSDFIAFAEKAGCIDLITRWMVREAMRFTQAERKAGQALQISVNLSMHDLRDKQLVQTMGKLLEQTGAQAADIRFEVTETVVMDDPNEMIAVLRELKQTGFELSVDDFGTGYSSLAYLQKMPVSELKIDRAFVSGAQPGGEAEALLDSVISLGHRLGLTVVAEGVETVAEWQLLQRLGCDYVQGWLAAKALPLTQFKAWRQANAPFVPSATQA